MARMLSIVITMIVVAVAVTLSGCVSKPAAPSKARKFDRRTASAGPTNQSKCSGYFMDDVEGPGNSGGLTVRASATSKEAYLVFNPADQRIAMIRYESPSRVHLTVTNPDGTGKFHWFEVRCELGKNKGCAQGFASYQPQTSGTAPPQKKPLQVAREGSGVFQIWEEVEEDAKQERARVEIDSEESGFQINYFYSNYENGRGKGTYSVACD